MELTYLPETENQAFSNSAPSPMGSLLLKKIKLYLKPKGYGWDRAQISVGGGLA